MAQREKFSITSSVSSNFFWREKNVSEDTVNKKKRIGLIFGHHIGVNVSLFLFYPVSTKLLLTLPTEILIQLETSV